MLYLPGAFLLLTSAATLYSPRIVLVLDHRSCVLTAAPC
jgi:hypothetical protein